MAKISRRRFLNLSATTAFAAAAYPVFGNPLRPGLADTPREWITTGQLIPSLSAFDQTMQKYMQARNISGGSLAVTRNSQLVMARAYSWTADEAEIVQPDSLFRIASITKPFTSTAIMILAQRKKLQLQQKVVGILDMQPPPKQKADPRLKDITILDLLQHLGGWDRDIAFDPMFHDQQIAKALGLKYPISTHDIITYMNGQPLQHDPGSTYAYSNYGYCILGRVIEKVSGQPYATFVHNNLLRPISIQSMIPGKSLLALRALNEVKYTTKDTGLYPSIVDSEAQVGVPYGTFNLENMDSHGRWISSAVDLVRFASTFDNPSANPFLTEDWIKTTDAPPAIGPNKDGSYYACGWMLTPAGKGFNIWHSGNLPGTTTFLIRRDDGLNWAALFNQDSDASGLDYGDIDPALHVAADSIRAWPDHDLFSQYAVSQSGG